MLGLLPWPPIPRTRARARRGRASSSRGESQAPIHAGSGAFTIGFRLPGTGPPPLTTIAWRLGHIIVGVLGVSVGNHFGGPPIDYQTFDYTGTAAAALERLDDAYDAWNRRVKRLDADGLARPCGPSEGPVRQPDPWRRSSSTSSGRSSITAPRGSFPPPPHRPQPGPPRRLVRGCPPSAGLRHSNDQTTRPTLAGRRGDRRDHRRRRRRPTS